MHVFVVRFFFWNQGFRRGLTIFTLDSPYKDVKSFAALSQVLESVGKFLIFVCTFS